MVPVVWAQAIGEYGVMAALSDKVAALYTQIEFSLRTDPEFWVLGGLVLVGVIWLFRRA
jgi:hypothetical protein